MQIRPTRLPPTHRPVILEGRRGRYQICCRDPHPERQIAVVDPRDRCDRMHGIVSFVLAIALVAFFTAIVLAY